MTISSGQWGRIEIETEVESWLLQQDSECFGRAEFAIDLLAAYGVSLGEPHTRQLRGKLRELRFRCARGQVRITYFVRPHRRIVLLTVFHKSKQRERNEVIRALRALERCLQEHQ